MTNDVIDGCVHGCCIYVIESWLEHSALKEGGGE